MPPPSGGGILLSSPGCRFRTFCSHVDTTKDRTTFLGFCRYLRSVWPPEIRIAIAMDDLSPRFSTNKDTRVGDWASADSVELAHVPTNVAG
jgi:hypothetical protein